jgi:hypothetical protein
MENRSPVRVENVQLELVEVPDNMNIIDPSVTLAHIDADGFATSADTCTFTVDRLVLINPAEMTWRVTFTVEVDDIPRIAELTFSNIIMIEPSYLANGDLTSDGRTDFEDFAKLAAHWLQDEPSIDIAPTPYGDGIIDTKDLRIITENWLMGVQ